MRSRAAEKDRYIDIRLQHRLREEYRAICRANHGVLISTACPADESYACVKKEVRKAVLCNENER